MWLVQNTVLLQFCSFARLIHWNKASQRGISVIKPNPRLIWEAVEDTKAGGTWGSFLSQEQSCRKPSEQKWSSATPNPNSKGEKQLFECSFKAIFNYFFHFNISYPSSPPKTHNYYICWDLTYLMVVVVVVLKCKSSTNNNNNNNVHKKATKNTQQENTQQ